MVMERGYSHARLLREFFYTQSLGIVRRNPRYCFCCSVTLISKCCNRAQARALGSPQNAIDNLALNKTVKKRNVLRAVQQIQQAAAGAQKFGRRLANGHGGTVRRRV